MRARGFRRAMAALCAAVVLGGMTPPDAPVAEAAMRGDVEAVRSLLRRGSDVNEAQGDGMTALHWAARHGNRELAEILVYAGAKLEAGTRIGSYTPLHVAAREGRAEVVELLLDAGSDPEARSTNSGATPLHLAARSGNAEIVSRLVEGGADVEAREGSWGQTPLTFAAALNRVAAIEALLAAGADPDASAKVIDVAEMAAADNAAEQRLQQVLEGFREQQGGGPGWQPTPSQVQAAVDLAREVQLRWPDVPKDGDPSNQDGGGEEAVEEAPEEAGEGEAAQEAPGAGAAEEPGAPGEQGPGEPVGGSGAAEEAQEAPSEGEGGAAEGEGVEQPERPLSYAQQVGRWGGLAPIHHAVRQGHAEATLALLEGGADIDRRTGDDTTPLLMAAINGQWDLASTLLEKGADPNIASHAGATPLYAVLEREWQPRASYAHPTEHQQQRTSHLELMERLLQAGADPDARLTMHLWYMEYTFGVLRGSGIDLKGATPFWRAAYALDVDAMRLLTAWGADPQIPTIKPPERRRREAAMEEESGQEPEAPEAEGDETGEPGPEDEHAPATGGSEQPDAETQGQEPGPEEEPESGKATDEEGDEGEDESGLPPVPVGGPAIHPLHAASGVGYGQSFAGNAHRHVPDGWLPAVRFLVEEIGVDVNVRDANGYTALHHAASRGDVEMILYLAEHGADVTVVSRKGETTADMANGPVQRVQPFPEAIALLESLGSENNHNCVSCE